MTALLTAWQVVGLLFGLNVLPMVPHHHCMHVPSFTPSIPCPPLEKKCCWCGKRETTPDIACQVLRVQHGPFYEGSGAGGAVTITPTSDGPWIFNSATLNLVGTGGTGGAGSAP